MTARTSPVSAVTGPVPPGCPILRREPVWVHEGGVL